MARIAGKDCRVYKTTASAITLVDIVTGIGTKSPVIECNGAHGMIIGGWLIIQGVTSATEINGIWQVVDVPFADTFEILTDEVVSAYPVPSGTVTPIYVQRAFEFGFNIKADELDVTEMTSNEWREFITGLSGGDVDYSYYKDGTELDVLPSSNLTAIFKIGNYELEAGVVILTREIDSTVEDVAKVAVTGRITAVPTEINN